jgi:hypothetical protein
MTADVEIRYWPHDKPIPDGWTRHAGLDGTHHGYHATYIVKDPYKSPVEVCQCGQALKTEDRSHGTFTLCCGRQLESCCGE